MNLNDKYPIFDLHCDLLSYLARIPNADLFGVGEIGCSLPYLQKGNVKLQVCAIYTNVEKGSTTLAYRQAEIFKNSIDKYGDFFVNIEDISALDNLLNHSKIGLLAAVENAAGLCEEDDNIDDAFLNLEKILEQTKRIAYIGITHHGENRFGGGNYSNNIGLKDDGKILLEFLSGKGIPIDFAHTSDALAHGIIEHIERKGLDIPLMASHSNLRQVYHHVRNLPDDLSMELIRRNGLIGINFLKAYIHENKPDVLIDHFLYGLKIGGDKALSIGADFFYTKDFSDLSRHPFYFKEHEDASTYPEIVRQLSADVSIEILNNITHLNVYNFFKRVWS
jgi:membrane dipeptidase